MPTASLFQLRELITPVTSSMMWRVLPSGHISTPLGTGPGNSRFAAPDGTGTGGVGQAFTVLYAASDLETALRETLIRDRFDGRSRRRLAEHTLRKHASAVIETSTPLKLLDLRDGKASNYGIPTRVRHGTNYNRSRRLSFQIHQGLPDVDGFLYRSRLDDGDCIAVFERSIKGKLVSLQQLTLAHNPLVRPALEAMRVSTFRWRGKS